MWDENMVMQIKGQGSTLSLSMKYRPSLSEEWDTCFMPRDFSVSRAYRIERLMEGDKGDNHSLKIAARVH